MKKYIGIWLENLNCMVDLQILLYCNIKNKCKTVKVKWSRQLLQFITPKLKRPFYLKAQFSVVFTQLINITLVSCSIKRHQLHENRMLLNTVDQINSSFLAFKEEN
jgi:hypothetical protein